MVNITISIDDTRRGSADPTPRQTVRRRSAGYLVVAMLLSVGCAACGGSGGAPTAPSANPPSSGSEVLSLELACQPSLIIGEQTPCLAVARLRSGATPVVSPLAAWSSAEPEVVAVNAIGLLTGRAGGVSIVSAVYEGRSAHATVSVVAEDALRVTAVINQGDFQPGAAVTMSLQGYHSVASDAVGRLSLQIRDQNGTLTQTAPRIVPNGGDFFLLSSSFLVPQTSTQICRLAILEIGRTTIAAPDPATTPLACVTVRR